ncbi:MAG: cob(I)yrinic acid a,c-diamide adenosyltransferase [Lachnospiraceae bacterium]|nr:cob(I)yrinic acid a,c-diamide adenosyltransferase [Lachnospiraceae bacterium]
MNKEVKLFCGNGRGKTGAAIGCGIQAACEGKAVFMVSFLKGKNNTDLDYLRKLEPEIKVFNFDKFEYGFKSLTEEEKQEERLHVRNGLNFAKKVIQTEECDVLILDEVLDLPAYGVVTEEELIPLLESVREDMQLIMTGTNRCERLWPHATRVTQVTTLKEIEE